MCHIGHLHCLLRILGANECTDFEKKVRAEDVNASLRTFTSASYDFKAASFDGAFFTQGERVTPLRLVGNRLTQGEPV